MATGGATASFLGAVTTLSSRPDASGGLNEGGTPTGWYFVLSNTGAATQPYVMYVVCVPAA